MELISTYIYKDCIIKMYKEKIRGGLPIYHGYIYKDDKLQNFITVGDIKSDELLSTCKYWVDENLG